MKKRIALALIVTMFVLPVNAISQTNGFSFLIENGSGAIWDVEIATNFTMWFTGGGYCAVENESIMTFIIDSVADDVYGTLNIGNVTVSTNDTMTAIDLALGFWPSWLPGLFVEVGQENIKSLNETAYAAAERVSGNWMNGTMSSQFENISVGQTPQECIVFDYEQDPPGTQVSHLAYSLATGVLVEADTSVTIGNPYRLVITLRELGFPTPVDFTVGIGTIIVFSGIIGGGMLAAIVIVYIRLGRQS
jgi:hypothetical protein